MEDVQDEFVSVDQLAVHGVGMSDVKKLKDEGIFTCNAITMTTRKVLTGVKGLSDAKVDKILEAAQKLLPASGFLTGGAYLDLRKATVSYITTGCASLNAVLGGGVETQSVTEVRFVRERSTSTSNTMPFSPLSLSLSLSYAPPSTLYFVGISLASTVPVKPCSATRFA